MLYALALRKFLTCHELVEMKTSEAVLEANPFLKHFHDLQKNKFEKIRLNLLIFLSIKYYAKKVYT